jgi:hypothetical protein
VADEQTTQTDEQTNSDQSTTTSDNPEQGSSSSTTPDQAKEPAADDTAGDETIDLGKGDETTDNAENKVDETTGNAEDEKPNPLFGAPAEDEGYEISGLPENMELDKDALAAIEPTARKLNLSNEGLSEIAGVYAEKVLPGVHQRIVDGINQDTVALRTQWETEARDAIAGKGEPLVTAAGTKLGFDGKSLKAVQADAAKALDHLAPAGFREFLEKTGLGVHPALIAEERELEPTETGGERRRSTGRPMTDPSKFYDRG